MENQIVVGTSYYPEQYPEERWETDAKMMKETGFTVVRIAEFGWAVMEPRDGVFDFSLFDRMIDLFRGYGISTVLGTPTRIPPVWMWKKHPEIVMTKKDGLPEGGGTLRLCVNVPSYKNYAQRIVEKMAAHFSANPAVIGWQIDNELRAWQCYCKHCSGQFRSWLKNKYGDIDNLNTEWGTIYHSQIFNSWDEVDVPANTELVVSEGSQLLDFKRFVSDSRVNFMNMQVEIIRKACPSHFITHNGLGCGEDIDYYDMAKNLDFFGFDHYPGGIEGDSLFPMSYDVCRGAKRKSFWILEQRCGYFNHSPNNFALDPGLVRLWCYRAVSRGADGIIYYRWRGGRFGSEQHPNSLLRHDGTPGRSLEEAARFASEMKNLDVNIAGTEFKAEAAILWSFEEKWAFGTHTQNSELSYPGSVKEHYSALYKLGVNVDMISPTADLGKYKIVTAPILFMLNEEIAKNLEHYVEAGGTLILTVRTGVKTWANTAVNTAWPGLARALAGVRVLEFDSLPGGYANEVLFNNKTYTVKGFLEILELETASELAVYNQRFYKGAPAITVNKYGRGKAIYYGVMGNDDLLTGLYEDTLKELNMVVRVFPEEIDVTYRTDGENTYMFVINPMRENREIYLDGCYYDLITKESKSGNVTIKSFDAMILVKK